MTQSYNKRSRRGYTVGKGRPPVETRWKAGESGNPKGRPKGAKNASTLVKKVLTQKLTIQEKGMTRTVSVLEAIVLQTTNMALKGDHKAIAFLLNHEVVEDIATTPPARIDYSLDPKMSQIDVAKKYLSIVSAVTKKKN